MKNSSACVFNRGERAPLQAAAVVVDAQLLPAAGAEQVVLARFERGDVLQGESLTEVRSRWRRFRATFAVDEPTLLVTHDAVVRVALLDISGRPLADFWDMRVENAAFAVVEAAGSTWTLLDDNVNSHLAELRAAVETQAL